jgi:hypothetical protein
MAIRSGRNSPGKIDFKSVGAYIAAQPVAAGVVLEMLFPAEFLEMQNADLAANVGPMIGRDLADSPPIMMKQLAANQKV